MSVLIVEDEPVFRANLLDRLLLAGLDVVSAPNGPIGLCFAEDPTLRFEAVVADLHLGGGIDGACIAEAVQKRHPGAKVVITSGRYDLLDLTWMSRGWTLMPKPFRLRSLAE
ncbi:MAG: response regulator, partial [Gluconacetobacter diazotrophicus]|nr:response regulator [Gluconacetobacter diazotrophicus]